MKPIRNIELKSKFSNFPGALNTIWICFCLLGLTLSWRRSLSYRNRSIDLQGKSTGWFLYDRDHNLERVKWLFGVFRTLSNIYSTIFTGSNRYLTGWISSVWHSEHWVEKSQCFSIVSGHRNALFWLNSRIPLFTVPILSWLLIAFRTGLAKHCWDYPRLPRVLNSSSVEQSVQCKNCCSHQMVQGSQ